MMCIAMCIATRYFLITKTKQDVYISDETGVGKVTLWEDHLHCLSLGASYNLNSFTVRRYQGENHLTRVEESVITVTDDIGQVVPYFEDPEEILYNVEIVGVPSVTNQTLCLKCSNRVEPSSDSLGRCSTCKMPQRMDTCPKQQSAKLLCMHDSTINSSEKKITQLIVNSLLDN